MPKAPTGAPKRFYDRAEVEARPEGFALVLDGRLARTPARSALVLPTRPLGEAVAAEWQGQGSTIDAATMPLTRLANTALDGVAREMEAVRAEIGRYAGSDLVSYRAEEPQRLVDLQAAAWDPVLAFARDAFAAPLMSGPGIAFVTQPAASLERIRTRLAEETSPFGLAALHVMTTLSGSALLPLMHVAGGLDADAAWETAHVDEDYQIGLWGEDEEAALRRRRRRADFMAASLTYRLARALN